MSNKKFRFGISFPTPIGHRELKDKLRQAQDHGFDVVCSADHLTDRYAVFPFLATVAEMTSLRVSPMVIANDYRHPAVTARDAATIDAMSEGRFELGIGTGWIEDQYTAAGLRYDTPGVRVERLQESITIIKALWTGEPATFNGVHYNITDLLSPKPVQDPHPPILIAGAGRKMMKLAGREADIVGISPLSPSLANFSEFGRAMSTSGGRISAQLGWIEEGAGDRFPEIEMSVTINHLRITDDPDSEYTRLAAEWNSMPADVASSVHVLVGDQQGIVDQLVERREMFGLSYVVVSAMALDEIGSVAQKLAGT